FFGVAPVYLNSHTPLAYITNRLAMHTNNSNMVHEAGPSRNASAPPASQSNSNHFKPYITNPTPTTPKAACNTMRRCWFSMAQRCPFSHSHTQSIDLSVRYEQPTNIENSDR